MKTPLTVLVALGLLWAGPASAVAATAKPPPLTISPAAGTPDASPATQISILGTPPRTIRDVEVTGSVSGAHAGSLEAYSKNRGASFIPDPGFSEGESVTAKIRIKGRKTIFRHFTIATFGVTQPLIPLLFTQPDKLQHFQSEPSLIPPTINVNVSTPRAQGEGSFLLTPLPSPTVHPGSTTTVELKPVGPGGPMIVDENGQLVWFRQLQPPTVAANLRLQSYRGEDVLTWWEGGVTFSAFGIGRGIIADHSYNTIATVEAGNGYPMDIHEFELTPEGDALFPIYSPILVHLPGTPEGKLSPLMDSIVQQVDVRTGLVVWEWHSYGHIPLEQSMATPANSATYDAFHINSIQQLPGGRALVSMRDTSAIYKIDPASGRIIWRLGGKASDFKLGKGGARFFFQHDARMLPGGRVSLFDDQAGPPEFAPSSRGLVLQLNKKTRRASVVREYHRQANTSAQSEGSFQTLDDGDVFVGWGAQPYFSQFSERGKLLFDANLPQDDGSYRVFREPWHAAPTTLPVAAATLTDPGHAAVYASWNGATEVASWEVLAGSSAGSMSTVGTAPRSGFETRIDVAAGLGSVVAVRALDASGKPLATSEPVTVP